MLDSTQFSLLTGQPLETNYLSYTASDGVELSYQRLGSGPPLLLIHGLGSSSMDWEFQYADLGKDYELIIPDLRGFGRSMQAYFAMSKPAISMALYASDMRDLMQHLGIQSCPVLGYSMGGAVAFQLAMDQIDHNEYFIPEALLIVNSLASFKIDTLSKLYQVSLRRLLARILSMPQMAKILSRKLFPDNPVLGDRLRERNSKNRKAPYIKALNALIDWQMGEYLEKIAQNTLFISADKDYTPPAHKERSAVKMKNARVHVIKDSMHGTPMDQPEEFNRVVLEFLKQI
ncbi:MAG: alpha/beta hydrolase [Gammaproteobacteria bacterium]|nr:alpha/beta hydrolase [Gammaproteobacteria bacterium]NNC98358.1 alpha/beta hydrolase [Gammaproteobacteria bacterium]NNM13745.1 alpha/beta hydrolase [Gammaproteobacteria bacterium]